MTSRNPITGDSIKTKPSSSYADKFDSIFRKPKEEDLIEAKDKLDEELQEKIK
jgi:hypothetical protein